MIITLSGPNSLLLGQELNKLSAAFIAEHTDLAVEKLDGEESSFERIQESLTSLPFLASKKMVILRAPSANKQFTERAEDLLKDMPESTDLVIVEPKLDKRLQYYRFLKKSTDFKEYSELDVNGLANWLVESANSKTAKLSIGDARYLIERVGQSQQTLSSELDKLITYDSNITQANIDLLTDKAPQSSIFDLIEAAFSGNSKLALRLYSEQRAMKVEPQQIVAMLAWQLNVLAIIKSAGNKSTDEIAKEAKLNPYVVRKSSSVAKRLSLEEIKDFVSALNKLDLRSKRSALDLDEALQYFILSLK